LLFPQILFLDEIHRFNKAQQDFLLPYVESGRLTLIGATTENPSFEVISALLSRCRVFVMEELKEEEIKQIIKRTKFKIKKDALVIANDVFRAVETVGLPECAINLAHGVSYLSEAKKDRSSYEAYGKALKDVKKYGNLPVPFKIRNTPIKLMKNLDYGSGYERYDTDSYLPDKLKNKKYLKKTK
jgi:replication-associated recombination protein RarA